MTLYVCKHSYQLCNVIFVNFYNFFSTMKSLRRHFSAQEIVNWVTTADWCVHTADATVLSRRRCVLDITMHRIVASRRSHTDKLQTSVVISWDAPLARR